MYHSHTEFEEALSAGAPVNDSEAATGEWCVEMLGKSGWSLFRPGLFRAAVRYGSQEEAVAAAVAAWRTHDKAARPRRLA